MNCKQTLPSPHQTETLPSPQTVIHSFQWPPFPPVQNLRRKLLFVAKCIP